MKKEKLSVIVPVYNVEKYLEKCLNSIINQTYKNLEIICIDDGSPDNSIKILEKYQLKDKRIRVIRQENKGLGATRNIGINVATGTYISFIDSDDWIELDMFEKCIEVFKKYNVDLVDCSTYYDSTINSQKVRDLRKLNYKNDYNGEEYFKLLVRNNLFSASSCNKVFKLKNIKRDNIYFPENKYNEDFYFVFVYLILSKKIGIVEAPMYHYLISRENSITNKINQNDVVDSIFMKKNIEETLKKKGQIEILSEVEYQEYIFNWIIQGTIAKVIQLYKSNKIGVLQVAKTLCKNEEFTILAKILIKNRKITLKLKIYIILLFFSPKLYVNIMIIYRKIRERVKY